LFGVDSDDFFNVDTLAPYSPLRDTLGSVLNLTDSSGTIQTTYQYHPTAIPRQLLGSGCQRRENDNDQQYNPNGTCFLRNRCYSPGLRRFLSRDSSGVAGGGESSPALVTTPLITATR
jgi:hypothetical protein